MNGEQSVPQSDPCGRYPTISVLVAAWNEANRIGDCLSALELITWPCLQVLVSAGGPDGTFDIARRHASERISVFQQLPGMGKQAALRQLFCYATGEIIYLTDGDTIVPGSTFRAVIEPILRGEAAAVTGNYRPYQDAVCAPLVFYQWSIDRAVERHRGPESEGITGANAVITRAALEKAGAFSADVKTGTDYVLARRLRSTGCTIRYVDAGVETEYAESARLFVKRRSRWLRNTFVHGLKFGDQREVRSSMITMGTGLASFAGLPMALANKWAGGLLWGFMIGLLLSRRLSYATELAAELGIPISSEYFLRLPHLLMLDQLASVMAATDLLSTERRTRW